MPEKNIERGNVGKSKEENRRYQGFSLIELMVVVIIISILASIVLPKYNLVVEKSRISEAVSTLKALYESQQRLRIENDTYATSGNPGGLDINYTSVGKFFNFTLPASASPGSGGELARATRLGASCIDYTSPYYFVNISESGLLASDDSTVTTIVQPK